MKKFLSVCIVVSMILVLGGCALMFKGTSEEVGFQSDPQRAEVFIDGSLCGTTPCAVKLETKKSYKIEIRMEGYQSYTTTITNKIGAGWIVLDILGGLIPVVVDGATGAWYCLDTKYVNAILAEQQ